MAKPAARPNRTAAYVYTTFTNATEYCEWLPGGDLAQKGRSIVIKGGAGLARKAGLLTSLGQMTEVSSDELEFLQANEQFKRHIEAGWVKVVKAAGWKTDADTVAADMAQRDGSAPYVPNDFKEGKAPTAGKTLDVGSTPTTKPRHNPRQSINTTFR